MVSLKELVDDQKFNCDDDLTIIERWFCLNNREQDGLDLISKLSKSKVDKLESILNTAKIWLPNIPDVYESNKKFGIDKDIASNINRITTYHLLGCEIPTNLLIWAEKTIPTIDTPKIIFIPMVEWLKTKYQIEFKDKIV